MPEVLIKDTLDIARLLAFCRALESERPGGLFHDAYARRLAGERGEELMYATDGGSIEQWPIALRTYIYDEIIQRLAEQEQIDAVINLAARLDSRPYRLKLPASLRWIEIDDPLVLAYKEELLASERPVCRVERVPMDITDSEARAAFLSRMSTEVKRALVLTEGLLVYLTPELVTALAEDLHEHASMHWWLTEIASPIMLTHSKGLWNTLTTENIQTHFAPPEGAAFFLPYGWRVAEFRSPFREAARLRLSMRFAWLQRLLTRLTPKQVGTSIPRGAGFLLLERIEEKDSPVEEREMP
jgi:methyltransferase (TIGR00027 family)